MRVRIVKDKISKDELSHFAKESFGEFVKAVVDVERNCMAVGGQWHADAQKALLADGSHPENLWGIRIYPENPQFAWIVFDSMINMRPSQGNFSRDVKDPDLRKTITETLQGLVQ